MGSAPSLLPSSKPHRIRTQICQLKLEENLTKSGTRLCDNTPTTVKIQKLPRRRLQIPNMKQCFPNPPPGSRPWSSLSTPKGSLQPPSPLISVSSPTINLKHEFQFVLLMQIVLLFSQTF